MMQKLYHVAGVEGKPVVFLLTDSQISKESFLEDVNNLLNSGEVAGMYAPEDKEGIIGSIREWLLTQGAPTTKVCLKPLLLMHLYLNLLLCCILCCRMTSYSNIRCAACLLKHASPNLHLKHQHSIWGCSLLEFALRCTRSSRSILEMTQTASKSGLGSQAE